METSKAHVTAIVQRMNAILSETKDFSSDVAAKNALLAANRELETSLRHPYETISCWAFSVCRHLFSVSREFRGADDNIARSFGDTRPGR